MRSARSLATRLQAQQDSLARAHKDAVGEVASLASRIECLSMTGELLRALLDKLVLDQVHTIETIVTEGLKSIFFDQDLSFEAEVGQSRGKVAIDLLIKSLTENGFEIKGPPLETFGGGISSMASLTLRLLALMRLKKFPLLILDETLSAVSAEYVDPAGQFLGKLAQTTGIPILLVTHNQSFLDHAKSAYQADKPADNAPIQFRKLRGT